MAARARDERDQPTWRAVTRDEAQILLGGGVQTVPGLQTLGYAVRPVPGGVEVRTELLLSSDAVLELLQRRALEGVTEANAVRRGDFVISGRAPVPRDSLRALLLRLH